MSRPRRELGRLVVTAAREWSRLKGKAFSLVSAGAFLEFGANSVLQPPISLIGEARIAVGARVWVGAGSWLHALDIDVGASAVRERSHTPRIVLGDGTKIAGTCQIAAVHRVRVGSDVLFARGVYIADHAHAFEDTDFAVVHQGINEVAPVEICDGAWLGQNVVVCPGVRIGRGAVVGANSVVLADVPDHAVAVGAPARVVREIGADRTADRKAT